ncbi:MAG TPA: 30S ribosomal protein S2 [Verrucomicrobiales bacterium]|nr:30S ribosomal protein S2 [Verrucomicrobiales bacterium]
MSASGIGIKELLDAGVHFGHQTRRWNPKMKQYIFDARNGIHIIDLSKTATLLDQACEFLRGKVAGGGKVLFIATKKQAQEIVKEAAKECGQFFSTERWLGGTLTNFKTIKNSIKRMKEIEKMESDGSINDYVKQEQSMIRREHARLLKYLDGIRDMEQFPDAVFLVDVKREHNAVAEVRKLKIPLVAIVDTNCDPDLVDHPVPANDDAIRSVKIILSAVTEAVKKGRAEHEAKYARSRKVEDKAEETAPAADAAAATATPAVSEAPSAPAQA